MPAREPMPRSVGINIFNITYWFVIKLSNPEPQAYDPDHPAV